MNDFNSLNDARLKLNEIFKKLERNDLIFDIEETHFNARLELECSGGPIYDCGDGAYCQNFVCIGTPEEIGNIADFCKGSVCITMSTLVF